MNRALALAIVVLAQSAALVAMVAQRQWTLSTGTPVVLETRPVDPRSLFSGDYVALNYAIGTLELEKLGGDEEFRDHDDVFVVLAPGEPHWTPLSVHRERPAAPAGQVAIRGEVQRAADRMWDPETRRHRAGRQIRVRYGIESYFVPEGEGRALERPRPGEQITIQVAVHRRGAAAIKAVLVNGTPRYEEKVF